MKFGSSDNPSSIDFTLPEDHPDTERILKKGKGLGNVYVGCAKWNRKDLKNFYPKGVKDELSYYASQFNSIELNATFYTHFSPEQIEKWVAKTSDSFRFFPKVHRMVTHIKRLNEVEEPIERYTMNIRSFGKKLGMCFMQLNENFKPTHLGRLCEAVKYWPADVPLAVELRNRDWFEDPEIASKVYALFEENGISNVITDTAGRRDLLHMRLTSPNVFVRYVGANHESDYTRLDDWVDRVSAWRKMGMETLNFFIHQNLEKASPLLSAHFTSKLNEALQLDLSIPTTPDTLSPTSFF